MADHWLPQLPDDIPNVYDSVAARARGGSPQIPSDPEAMAAAMAAGSGENTAIADYVWLPIRFDGSPPYIAWLDEWRTDDFD